ncbi:uncharacterized protein WCC33_014822 [Rhinophrynus dorsalis]
MEPTTLCESDRGMSGRLLFPHVIYLDDILIYSSILQEHRNHVQQVLQQLRAHSLYAKLEKCVFETSQIEFLGFVIASGSITMDPWKVTAILDWPAQTNIKELQRIVGSVSFFRTFICGFPKSLLQLQHSLATNIKHRFAWSEAAQTTFDPLKTLFTTAPILVQPDPSKAFFVEVNASDIEVGAVLF